VQDLAVELDLELADRAGAEQAAQRRDELAVGLVVTPALAGRHVDGDRTHQLLGCWPGWRSCAQPARQRQLLIVDVDVAVGRHARLGLRAEAAACIVRSAGPAPAVCVRAWARRMT
jgi:hypothetical protein